MLLEKYNQENTEIVAKLHKAKKNKNKNKKSEACQE